MDFDAFCVFFVFQDSLLVIIIMIGGSKNAIIVKAAFGHESSCFFEKRINHQLFKVFQISLFQLIFTDFWLLRNLLTGTTTGHVLKNTLSEH